MKLSLFPRLSWMGIKKNKRLYIPYILTCIGMVAMSFILQNLSYSPALHHMEGGRTLEIVLSLGKFVIAVFSLIFLTYTNSFLIRRRNKEFGLYNILGMDKRKIARILVWESLIISAISLVLGISIGIALSKLAELGLCNILRIPTDYSFTLEGQAIVFTVCVFAVIFLLLFIKSILQVSLSKPLELLGSENLGEKPPRANWVLALLGVIILGAAYAISISIKSPLSALTYFFVAVVMTIIATYMLFTAGSVALCRLLRRNKNYYYKKEHFVSVSSMAYRMKRNGAGLASICILCTMVLVMISSTLSLYIGEEDILNDRFPYGNFVNIYFHTLSDASDENISAIDSGYQKVFDSYDVQPQNVYKFRYAYVSGMLTGSRAELDPSDVEFSVREYEDLRQFCFMSTQDYNSKFGTDISLQPGQAMIYTYNCTYDQKSLSLADVRFDIIGKLDEFIPAAVIDAPSFPTICLVVPDYETLEPINNYSDYYGSSLLSYCWYYGFDLNTENDVTAAVLDDFSGLIRSSPDFEEIMNHRYGYNYGSKALEHSDFYVTFGGLFFIGIILSIVFIFAAVLIIYYKQISEGYEDKSRFDVMRKVGMTKTDIRKSINSQVLTVFFAPLILAGLHLAFAFPLVWKLLQLFYLQNLKLVIIVTICAFLIFGVLYAIVYRLTSNSYYTIVSGAKRDK